ncbi:hypothetical protein MKL09_04420 [Methylobacterium sp. J-048]|uniref:hypothetical protein n=1 Tax=Methylobacterium sp. J-048 TaxID=2836635 RepID=UPI001FBACD5E|nr:hypothetical protein [Methylobacterium sp. J-048]MCJ2055791.1 hypothetical protein [Methylobacterium sp. J-048]
MDHLDMPENEPDAIPADGAALTPLQVRIGTCQAEAAQTFRALQAVSGQAAAMLENGSGTVGDFVGLITAFEQLQQQAGAHIACLGAAISSAGSARPPAPPLRPERFARERWSQLRGSPRIRRPHP